jgi:hypothetical protein
MLRSEQAKADLEAGRAVVYLSDGETWCEVADCEVRFHSEEEEWEWGDGPKGWVRVPLETLIRHYLENSDAPA